LNTICLLIAGALRATLPSETFTLAWDHSVEKTRWEEDYRVEPDGLHLVESRIAALGAGMEPPAGAQLIDGTWRWHPALAAIPELRLTSSPFASDYRVCWNGHCEALRKLTRSQDIEVVSVVPCPG
jgi:hypothetical protein